MATRKKRARPKRESPGGPGGMAALRRAQEKMKAMGIRPWKAPAPPAPKRSAPAPAPAEAPAPAARPRAPVGKKKRASTPRRR